MIKHMSKDDNKLTPELQNILFDDIFDKPMTVDKGFKKQNKDTIVEGDARLSIGLYYTDKEKEKYIKRSLKRKLPKLKEKDREK